MTPVCAAPGPLGLRCDRPRHWGAHGHDFGGGIDVTWHDDAPDVGRIWPSALSEGLAALGAVLADIGDALRGGP